MRSSDRRARTPRGASPLARGLASTRAAPAITYSILRCRDRGGAEPEQVEGNTRLEILWTLAPVCVLIGIFALTMRAMNGSDPAPDREPDLTVIAHQWWWEVRYKSGVV